MIIDSTSKLAPIALFAYRRPSHLRRTLEALAANAGADESELHIFVDGPKTSRDTRDVRLTREVARGAEGFRRVVVREAPINQGLSHSIISGVTMMLEVYPEVVVLEDDIETSPHFLQFMNEALAMYRYDEQVASIHGYTYPVTIPLPETFFLLGADCWGWATWRRAWSIFNPDGRRLWKELVDSDCLSRFDFDCPGVFSGMLRDQIEGRNDSWAIRWYASAFLAGMHTLYPGESFVRNFGFDGSGTHGGLSDLYQQVVRTSPLDLVKVPTVDCELAREAFSEFLCNGQAETALSMSGLSWRLKRKLTNLALKFSGR